MKIKLIKKEKLDDEMNKIWFDHLDFICIDKDFFNSMIENIEYYIINIDDIDKGIVFYKKINNEKSQFIIYIPPELRRNKYGTGVLKEVEEMAKKRDVKFLELVSVEECNALRFYEINGFNDRKKDGRFIYLTKKYEVK